MSVVGLRRENVVEVLDGAVVLFREVQQESAIATPFDLARVKSKRLIEIANRICAASVIFSGSIGPLRESRRALCLGNILSRDNPIACRKPVDPVGVVVGEPPVLALIDISLTSRERRAAQKQGDDRDGSAAQ